MAGLAGAALALGLFVIARVRRRALAWAGSYGASGTSIVPSALGGGRPDAR